jgi:hypothetical protein
MLKGWPVGYALFKRGRIRKGRLYEDIFLCGRRTFYHFIHL